MVPVPQPFTDSLRLPVIAAPMFLASSPQLVTAACKAGIVGTLPALNQRTTEGLALWLEEIAAALQALRRQGERDPAPYGVNLIVHRSNPRLRADLEVCVRHQVPLVITSLGAVREVVDEVHAYGGLVFHDVINLRHARKAAAAGVDGLIAVAAGAGGHAGTMSPFALVNEIRQFFEKTVILAGALATGRDVAAAQMIGADLAYLGTRFLATQESMAPPAYKDLLAQSHAADIVYTPQVSGVHGNFLRQSIEAAGLDPNDPSATGPSDVGAELAASSRDDEESVAWRDIWSAGQGVGSIHEVVPVADLVLRLEREYIQAVAEHAEACRRLGVAPARSGA